MGDEQTTTEALLADAAMGNDAAWGALLTAHQARLTQIIAFRMDSRLRGRVDAADILQESFAEAALHRDAYFRCPDMPLFIWLRGIVRNKLLEIHRYHLGTRMRDAKRERSLHLPSESDDASVALYEYLTAGLTGPSVAVVRSEINARLAETLKAMNPADCELLAMRHYEQLTNMEVALVLGVPERTAAKRYLRALERLKNILAELPGGLSELRT